MRRVSALILSITLIVIARANVSAVSGDDKAGADKAGASAARAQELLNQARVALGGEAKLKAVNRVV